MKNTIQNFGNRTPFKEPENYFEKLPSIINSKIAPKKVSFFEKTKPILYFAAMFLGFYVIIHFAIRTLNNDFDSNSLLAQQEKQTNNTTTEDSYYNYVVSELDEEMIVDYLLAKN